MSIETEKERLTGALNCKDELAVFVRTSGLPNPGFSRDGSVR